jgi:hypothetical protein
VTFVSGSAIYAVNDAAAAIAAERGFRSIELIRRDIPYLGGKVSLDEMAARGAALCTNETAVD